MVTITSVYSSAGENQTKSISSLITLNGTASGDALDHDLLYSWEILTVPDFSEITTIDLSNSTTINPTFTPDELGDYIAQLEVNDGLIFDISNVTITVT